MILCEATPSVDSEKARSKTTTMESYFYISVYFFILVEISRGVICVNPAAASPPGGGGGGGIHVIQSTAIITITSQWLLSLHAAVMPISALAEGVYWLIGIIHAEVYDIRGGMSEMACGAI